MWNMRVEGVLLPSSFGLRLFSPLFEAAIRDTCRLWAQLHLERRDNTFFLSTKTLPLCD